MTGGGDEVHVPCPTCGEGPLIGHGTRSVVLPRVEGSSLTRIAGVVRRYRCRACGNVAEPDTAHDAARAAAREFVAVAAFRTGINAAAAAAGVNAQTCARWIRQWLDDARLEASVPTILGILSLRGGDVAVLFDAGNGRLIDAGAAAALPDMLAKLDPVGIESVYVDFDQAALRHAEICLPRTHRAVVRAATQQRLDIILGRLLEIYPCRDVAALRDDVRLFGWTRETLLSLQYQMRVCGEGMRRQAAFVELWKSEIIIGLNARVSWPGPGLDFSGVTPMQAKIAATICVRGIVGPPSLETFASLIDEKRRESLQCGHS